MRVQMAVNIVGVRDGQEWPRPGGVIDLPDAEAEDLIRNGYARRVADDFVPAAVDDHGQPVVDDDGNQVPVTSDGARTDALDPQAPPRVVQGTDTLRPLPPKAENVVDPEDAENRDDDIKDHSVTGAAVQDDHNPDEDKAKADKPEAEKSHADRVGDNPFEAATVKPDTPEENRSKPKLRRGGH